MDFPEPSRLVFLYVPLLIRREKWRERRLEEMELVEPRRLIGWW
jgi:hypothetical protein